MSAGVTVREATRADAALVLSFIQGLADYERLRHECMATLEDVERTVFGPDAVPRVLIAEWEGEPVGFALWFRNYSTFLARPGIYLEDLFVKPEARGKGAGRALLAALARIAVERGYGRVEWAVLDWNAPSIEFYRSLGAVAMEEWTVFRLTGDAMRRLRPRNRTMMAHRASTRHRPLPRHARSRYNSWPARVPRWPACAYASRRGGARWPSPPFSEIMRPIRVLVAKPGLDGHDRGAKVVAAALRDAGMEVIYTGLHQTPEMIATAAVQEDVDVVGLSILSGAHMTLFPRVLDLMREQGRDDILITGGGIIPREDMEALEARGIGRLFGPGTPTSDLVDYIKGWFAEREQQEA